MGVWQRAKSVQTIRWAAVAESVLDAVYPPACALCATPVTANHTPLCRACLEHVGHGTGQSYCGRCGRTEPPFGSRPGGCGRCVEERLRYDGVIRVGSYIAALARLLRAFKFAGREDLAGYFGDQLARRVARSEAYESIDALLAVPTCWRHRLRRRHHAAELLARQVSERCALPMVTVLARVQGGPDQIGLPVTERLKNVRGKFRLARGYRIEGARLCLVDERLQPFGQTLGAQLNGHVVSSLTLPPRRPR